ncbi:unnamed protein product, partial [Rotaria sp. Silwood1]
AGFNKLLSISFAKQTSSICLRSRAHRVQNFRMTGAKGYLKVSVNILGPGDEAPVTFFIRFI